MTPEPRSAGRTPPTASERTSPLAPRPACSRFGRIITAIPPHRNLPPRAAGQLPTHTIPPAGNPLQSRPASPKGMTNEGSQRSRSEREKPACSGELGARTTGPGLPVAQRRGVPHLRPVPLHHHDDGRGTQQEVPGRPGAAGAGQTRPGHRDRAGHPLGPGKRAGRSPAGHRNRGNRRHLPPGGSEPPLLRAAGPGHTAAR